MREGAYDYLHAASSCASSGVIGADVASSAPPLDVDDGGTAGGRQGRSGRRRNRSPPRVVGGWAVVIWLNGAFGVGKTSVARLLVERLEGATLVDPEKLGFLLQRLPGRARGDFQDMAAWRRGTVHAVRLASKFAVTSSCP